MGEAPVPADRLVESYRKLAATADVLSAKSDALSNVIGVIDSTLQGLNLGIIAWEKISGVNDEDAGSYWSKDVGYAKIHGIWGLAIRETRGNHHGEDHEVEEWLFSNAPRSLRIEALDKIPDLLDKLNASAEKTARKIEAKTQQAGVMAQALMHAAAEVRKAKGKK